MSRGRREDAARQYEVKKKSMWAKKETMWTYDTVQCACERDADAGCGVRSKGSKGNAKNEMQEEWRGVDGCTF
jgi:hypothetical protein